jgi:trk system potassium uptake protein TrkH
VTGFAVLTLAGTLLLMLPSATATGAGTPLLDALFTATSAVSGTGLVVADTADYWSVFGQVVILLLMELGGLGFMTSATVLILLFRRRVSLRERLLLRTELGAEHLAGLDVLVRRIVLISLAIQAIGMVVLTLLLAGRYALADAAWHGLFLAVSTFTNAGFDLFGGFRGLTGFQHEPLFLLSAAALVILGGLGVSPLIDLAHPRQLRRASLDTKLVLVSTGLLLGGGTLALAALEWQNSATLGALPPVDRLVNAFFHSASPRSAGFNTLDMTRLTSATLLVTIVLMFIGAAPRSMAAGIRVTTTIVLALAAVATLRGQSHAVAFGRQIPQPVVMRALTVLLLAVLVVLGVTLALTVTEGVRFEEALFEAVSAFSTCGMTTGLSVRLSGPGKVILAITMLAGRLGLLTLALALARYQRPASYQPAEAIVTIV